MKREFGRKLIEEFLPSVDITCVIDTQLAHIPGHGIPTVILIGRDRAPVSTTLRVVGAIKREDSEPTVASEGLVWTSILSQIDLPGSQDEYVSVKDVDRESLAKHPWSIGGGGASELKELLDKTVAIRLSQIQDSIGPPSFPGQDDAFVAPVMALMRRMIPAANVKPFIYGEAARDWAIHSDLGAIVPYGDDFEPLVDSEAGEIIRALWPLKTTLGNVVSFGGRTRFECGELWWTWYRWIAERYRVPLSIVFAYVSTQNHFGVDRSGNVFHHSALSIYLKGNATEDAHVDLAGVLNSSVACFWMKQVCHCKGGGGIGGGVAAESWERFFEFNSTKLLAFPLPDDRPDKLARTIESAARQFVRASPDVILNYRSAKVNSDTTSFALNNAESTSSRTRGEMIRLQEDLDWQCYRLYGLIDEDLTHDAEPFPIDLGQRAFEIVLARKMAADEVQTTWFERHGSTPITEVPTAWPEDYKRLVERRIEVIESNPQIALIEQPEYKRRWNTEPWESQVERALRNWLLDRLEGYFDFDGRMSDQQSAGSGQKEAEPQGRIAEGTMTSVGRLADIASKDEQFMEVGSVYRDDLAFNVPRLVEELVTAESVPLLPVLRYKPSGLRKREQWEETWELQRREDAGEDVGEIPVPPKYKSSDFISTGGARYWALRGKLDVPKERWISFPHCEGEDGTLIICWAGYDHLQQARAISAHYVDIQERLGGRDDPRLIPLLACLIELLPWLKQWHNDVDPQYGVPMGDYFEGFVTEEARNLGKTVEEIRGWEPPKKVGRRKKVKA